MKGRNPHEQLTIRLPESIDEIDFIVQLRKQQIPEDKIWSWFVACFRNGYYGQFTEEQTSRIVREIIFLRGQGNINQILSSLAHEDHQADKDAYAVVSQ